MQGMYFAMIVDPAGGWGTKADKEFVLVQSEFYSKPAGEAHEMSHDATKQSGPHEGDSFAAAPATAAPDWNAAMDKDASYVVFNGRAFQYKHSPLKVDVGDRVRFFVVNAGPSFRSDFHVVGAVFDRVYPTATRSTCSSTSRPTRSPRAAARFSRRCSTRTAAARGSMPS